ncbi:MAG TPA: beta-ketoacyl synthase chain length factor [Burkholderiales bacterium]|nr:beta-ketoacyl synthase chain length factor [Burkholderiales bacterium]
MQVFVESVGLLGPGLSGWPASRPVLTGVAPYVPGEVPLPSPDALPAAERRRTGLEVRLALNAGLDALVRSARPPETLASVFTSCCGEGHAIHQICEALATAERVVSPTSFHNSVHNAPAGYWSIAQRSQAPSTSLCCFEWSFNAGLLEACAYCLTEARPVLLISYDLPYPEPVHAVWPMTGTLGAALLLAPRATSASFARLDVQTETDARAPTRMQDPALEALRSGNPTGRALPLLRALAGPAPERLVLEYLTDSAALVTVTPC